MARKKFTLEVDGDNPQVPGQGHIFQGGISGQNVVDPVQFNNMLAQGKLTTVGYIYQGDLPASPADVQSETYSGAEEQLSGNCLIVYVGGTSYKVCS